MWRWLVCAIAVSAAFAGDTTLKVAAVQFRSTFDVGENCGRIVRHIEGLAKNSVNVAVFPECALTGYDKDAPIKAKAEQIRDAESTIANACKKGRIAAVVGSVYHVNGKVFNSAVVINSRGQIVERYGKIHLAGEKWATAGNHIAFFDLDGVASTVMICHDERYPELVRLPAMAGARVVYYISHESGMREEEKLAPYRAQLMARAVENGVWIIAANAPGNRDLTGSHGQSRIVASDGNVRKEGSFFGEDVLVDSVTVRPGKLQAPLKGVLGDWWRTGMESMLANCRRPLE
jgi:predicted amidohydrolase